MRRLNVLDEAECLAPCEPVRIAGIIG